MALENKIVWRSFPTFNQDGEGVHVTLRVSCAGCDQNQVEVVRDGDWVDWQIGAVLDEEELIYCLACQQIIDSVS